MQSLFSEQVTLGRKRWYKGNAVTRPRMNGLHHEELVVVDVTGRFC